MVLRSAGDCLARPEPRQVVQPPHADMGRCWCPPEIHIGNPNAPCDGNRRAFGRCLGHEGGARENGISVLLRETPESSLATFILGGPKGKDQL